MMKRVFETVLVLMAMICLILEKSSCYQILVVGLLLTIAISLDKNNKLKM